MVDSQLRTNRVVDEALIAALSELPREDFVPDRLAAVAYVDADLPLDGGRFLMEPMVFARLVQLLAVAPGDIVLDIGCASGYSSAVLARLCSTVVALECDPALAETARRNLARAAIDNVIVVDGDAGGGAILTRRPITRFYWVERCRKLERRLPINWRRTAGWRRW